MTKISTEEKLNNQTKEPTSERSRSLQLKFGPKRETEIVWQKKDDVMGTIENPLALARMIQSINESSKKVGRYWAFVGKQQATTEKR